MDNLRTDAEHSVTDLPAGGNPLFHVYKTEPTLTLVGTLQAAAIILAGIVLVCGGACVLQATGVVHCYPMLSC